MKPPTIYEALRAKRGRDHRRRNKYVPRVDSRDSIGTFNRIHTKG